MFILAPTFKPTNLKEHTIPISTSYLSQNEKKNFLVYENLIIQFSYAKTISYWFKCISY